MKAGRGNTYDNNEWPGCSAFVASLWIAALRAASDIMRLTGGSAAEAKRYDALAAKAVESMSRRLWNGSFYKNFDCDDPSRRDSEDCLLPQVAGEWALDLTDLPRGLPEDKTLSALRQIYIRNIVGHGFKGPCDEVMPNGDPALLGHRSCSTRGSILAPSPHTAVWPRRPWVVGGRRTSSSGRSTASPGRPG